MVFYPAQQDRSRRPYRAARDPDAAMSTLLEANELMLPSPIIHRTMDGAGRLLDLGGTHDNQHGL